MSIKNLLNDPNLSPEEEDRIIGAFVKSYEQRRLKARYTQRLSAQYGVEKKESAPPRRTKIIRICLAVAAVAAAVVFLLLPAARSPLDDFLSVEGVVAPIVRSDQQQNEIYTYFSRGEYGAAVSAGESLKQANAQEAFFLGLSYLGTENYSAALATFAPLRDEGRFSAEANWYYSLLLLKLDRPQEALPRLRSYRSGDDYYDEARELIEAYGE